VGCIGKSRVCNAPLWLCLQLSPQYLNGSAKRSAHSSVIHVFTIGFA